MENIIKNYGWFFTQEEVNGIKNGNVETMTKFYNVNYNHILAICKNWLFKHRNIKMQGNLIELDDLLNQVFCDLPFYDFKRLYFEIIRSCNYINNGGYMGYNNGNFLSVESLDKEVFDGLTLASVIPDKKDYFTLSEDLAEREEKDKRIFNFLDHHIKDESHRNEIFCMAFTDIPKGGINGNEYKEFKAN